MPGDHLDGAVPGDQPAGTVTADRRGRRLYDRWSRGGLRAVYAVAFLGRERAFRRRSVAALSLSPGDRVLELGCGPGNSLARLREQVGPDGTVVAADYSAGMVSRASARVRTAGWDDVHVVRADATRPPVGYATFDAVYASMSLSAMADPEAAVRAAAASLRSGGRLAVLDARPFPARPWTALNPVVVPVARRLTNWYPDVDVVAALERTFEGVSVETHVGGAVYIAAASAP